MADHFPLTRSPLRTAFLLSSNSAIWPLYWDHDCARVCPQSDAATATVGVVRPLQYNEIRLTWREDRCAFYHSHRAGINHYGRDIDFDGPPVGLRRAHHIPHGCPQLTHRKRDAPTGDNRRGAKCSILMTLWNKHRVCVLVYVIALWFSSTHMPHRQAYLNIERRLMLHRCRIEQTSAH